MKSTILAETGFSTGNGIEVPTQLILKSEKDGFVSRFRKKGGTEFGGHYCNGALDVAKEQFITRVHNHNEEYPTGNASHVGPIEWPHNKCENRPCWLVLPNLEGKENICQQKSCECDKYERICEEYGSSANEMIEKLMWTEDYL